MLNGDSGAGTSLKPRDLFIDLEGTNTAFRHWHPMPVAEKGGKLCGQADLGGVWEWTSTTLDKHDGFEPMPLYPGYTGMLCHCAARLHRLTATADFFDKKHNVVLGGSWATHPRIAGRKTL